MGEKIEYSATCDRCPHRVRVEQKRFNFFLALSIALLLGAFAQRACAQDDHTAIPLVVDRAQGVWWPLPEARIILQHARERPVILERLRLTTEALSLARTEVRLTTAARLDAEEIAENIRAQLRASQARVDDLNAWYREPVLWASVGFVLGGALVTALALSL